MADVTSFHEGKARVTQTRIKVARKEQLRKDYQKERRRLLSQYRSMLRRGYVFPKYAVPKIPKRITDASIRRLKRMTKDYLYAISDYQDIGKGIFLTGKQGREYERSKSAQKAARHRNPILKALDRERDLSNQEMLKRMKERKTFAERQREMDEENKRRLLMDEEFREQFSDENQALNYFYNFLNDHEDENPVTVDYIRQMAKSQNQSVLAERLLNNADIYDSIETMIDSEQAGQGAGSLAWMKVQSTIQGGALSGQESRAATDRYERDRASFDIDEGITD